MAQAGVRLLRPARKGEPDRAGARLFKPLRQLIESVNATLKASWTSNAMAAGPRGGLGPVLQRVLALTTAVWHNHTIGQSTLRSLIAYDH